MNKIHRGASCPSMYSLAQPCSGKDELEVLGNIGALLLELTPRVEQLTSEAVDLVLSGNVDAARQKLSAQLGPGLPNPVCHEKMLKEWVQRTAELGYDNSLKRAGLMAISQIRSGSTQSTKG